MSTPPIDYRFTYRAQLDRVRRMRARFDDRHDSMEAAQDIMWSFFQNCWHVWDWVEHDPALVTPAQRAAVALEMRKVSKTVGSTMMLCRGICNATKHLETKPGEARHSHMNANIGGNRPRMECIIDDGNGNRIAGHDLADRCIAEWERILTAQGLSVAAVPT
jgi:hypothetical protein